MQRTARLRQITLEGAHIVSQVLPSRRGLFNTSTALVGGALSLNIDSTALGGSLLKLLPPLGTVLTQSQGGILTPATVMQNCT
jgi:hypothetical protein